MENKASEIFERKALEHMTRFNVESFKRSYSTLYQVIIESIEEGISSLNETSDLIKESTHPHKNKSMKYRMKENKVIVGKDESTFVIYSPYKFTNDTPLVFLKDGEHCGMIYIKEVLEDNCYLCVVASEGAGGLEFIPAVTFHEIIPGTICRYSDRLASKEVYVPITLMEEI